MIGLLVVLGALAGRGQWAPARGVTDAYNLAIDALDAGQPAQAEQLLGVVLSVDEDCGMCQHALAIALLRQQRSSEAVDLLVPLARRHSRGEVLTLLATAALASGELRRAREAASEAVRQDPADFEAQRILLRVLLAAEDEESVRWALAGARKHLSDAQWGCLEVERAAAAGELLAAQGAMALCRGGEDAELVAETTLRLTQVTGDLAEMEAAATTLGLTGLVSKVRAARLLAAGDATGAMALLEGVLTASPADRDALLLRAWCRQASGDAAGAMLDLEAVLIRRDAPQVSPSGTLHELYSPAQLTDRARGLYARLLIDQDRLDEAGDILAEGDGRALAAARIRLALARERPEDAVALLTAAIARWPAEPELPAAALLLAAEQPLTDDTIAWLQGLPEPGPVLQLATLAYHDGRYSQCIEALGPLIPTHAEHSSEADSWALPLAHRCAVAAGELPIAESLLVRMMDSGTPPVPETAIRHAWLLGEAGEQDAALALLGQITPGPDTATRHRSLRLSLLTAAGLLDEAVAVSEEGAVEPPQLANLAVALHTAGRTGQARSLMAAACAEMSGEHARRCRDGLGRM